MTFRRRRIRPPRAQSPRLRRPPPGHRLWIVGPPALVDTVEASLAAGAAEPVVREVYGGLAETEAVAIPIPGCRGWRLVTQQAGSVRAAPLSAAIALSVCIALATFGVLAPLVHWVVPATELPPPFTEQHQDAETLLFILAFAFALPLSLLAGPRVADRIAAGPNAASLGAAAALALVLLFGAVVFVKFSEHLPWGTGLGTLLVASLAWFLLAGALVARLARLGRSPAR